MTRDELFNIVNKYSNTRSLIDTIAWKSLNEIVKLHKPDSIPDWVPTEEEYMCWCAQVYPCPTIKAIEKVFDDSQAN
ncbi:MAG: hypothetical protein EBS18_05250 [Actinobacteria bacterium]|nr:hypothetical protein [Actinomycetota bacterium]